MATRGWEEARDLPRAHVSLVTRGADPGQTWQRLRGVWGEVGGTAGTGFFWAPAARGLRAGEGCSGGGELASGEEQPAAGGSSSPS